MPSSWAKKIFKRKDWPNLITVDLLCHGVPSPGVFVDFLEDRWGIKNIEKIEMRKLDGWKSCLYIYIYICVTGGGGYKKKW